MKSINEMLAADINNFLYENDPYGYIDDNGSLDNGYARCLSDINAGETGGIIIALNEFNEDPAAVSLLLRLNKISA